MRIPSVDHGRNVTRTSRRTSKTQLSRMATEQEKVLMGKKWNDADRQAFADRNILKAQRVADKRKKRNKNECRGFRWNGAD